MNIATVVDNNTSHPTILGVAFDRIDRPLIDYWRKKAPQDFREDHALTRHWLEFELGGIRRGQSVLQRLAGHVALADKVVLDIGAGNGGMCIAAALAGARKVYGVEVMEDRIDLALRWARCRGVNPDIRQGVAESLPFPNESMDVVVLWSVIEHVEDTGRTIKEMARVLRPGGYALLNAPNRLSPRFFLSDPHYQLMAVSALPRPIAKWWVTKVKKVTEHYGVGIFPIYSLLVRRLRAAGFDLVATEHNDYLLPLLEDPQRIRSSLRTPARISGALGINRVAATILRNTAPLFELVLRKT